MEYGLNEILFPYTKKMLNKNIFLLLLANMVSEKEKTFIKRILQKIIQKNKVIRTNTLTIRMRSTQIDIGILSANEVYSDFPAYHTYKINRDIVFPKFLERYSKSINSKLSKLYMIASTRQVKSIDFERKMKHKVDISSLVEQKKIVENLEKINYLTSSFNNLLNKYDVLVKSKYFRGVCYGIC